MQGDPRDEDSPAPVLPTRYGALQQLVAMVLLEDEPSPIAQSFLWAEVPHEHEGHPWLEADLVPGKTGRVQGVDVLCAVSKCVCLVVQEIGAGEFEGLTRK